MKIVIAPDSFKESATATEIADAVEEGMKRVFPEANFVKIPMADGGEGTVHSLISATNGEILYRKVTGPLGEPVQAFFGILGDQETAVIEMAAAAGLHLVTAEQKNPLVTTTFGVGELILEAVNIGAKKVILGLGGSSTNDGGAGMLQALGVKLLTKEGEPIGFGGGSLSQIESIDVSQLDERLGSVLIQVACDVDTPFVGETGASAIFGPQKGATPGMVQVLDRNLTHFSNKIKTIIGKDISSLPGSGAAGGLGGGIVAFLNAELKSGVDIVIDATNLHGHIKDADLVITGEGKIDSQTIYGKTPIGVARVAKKYNVPVVGIAGQLSDDSHVVKEHGIDALFCIVPGVIDLEHAKANAKDYITRLAENIATVWKMAK